MIVDTSVLLAFFRTNDHAHADALRVIGEATDALVVSPYVAGEVDYMLATWNGVQAELAALRELAGGAYELAEFGGEDLLEAAAVIERYSDQNIGLTDASLVVLAKRHGTRTIATLDRRHFEILRPLDGGRFTLVP